MTDHRTLLLILLATSLAGTALSQPDQKGTLRCPAGWRGDGTGIFGSQAAPVEWSAAKGVIWKTKLPSWSNSSPALANDRLFVFSEPNVLLCLRREDGTILWQVAVGPGKAGGQKEVGGTTPTPAADPTNGRVFAFNVAGTMGAHDFDGTQLWTAKVSPGPAAWGHSSSPLLVAGHLVVCHGGVTAFDPGTGEVRWTAESGMRQGSPIAVTVAGKPCVVVPAGHLIDVGTGLRMAGSLPNLKFNAPLAHGNVVYGVGVADTKAIAVALPEDSETAPKKLWETEIKKGRYFASPVCYGGLVFGVRQSGTVIVLDAKTGEKKREHRFDQMHESKGQCYPSLTLAGGHLYVSSDNGTTMVLEPTPELKVVAENHLERTRGCMVFAGDRLFIRGMDHLYCIGKE